MFQQDVFLEVRWQQKVTLCLSVACCHLVKFFIQLKRDLDGLKGAFRPHGDDVTELGLATAPIFLRATFTPSTFMQFADSGVCIHKQGGSAHSSVCICVCVLAKLFSCGLYASCSCGTCSGGKNSHFLLCASSSNYILATQTLAGLVIAQHVNSSSYIALATCQRKQRTFKD